MRTSKPAQDSNFNRFNTTAHFDRSLNASYFLWGLFCVPKTLSYLTLTNSPKNKDALSWQFHLRGEVLAQKEIVRLKTARQSAIEKGDYQPEAIKLSYEEHKIHNQFFSTLSLSSLVLAVIQAQLQYNFLHDKPSTDKTPAKKIIQQSAKPTASTSQQTKKANAQLERKITKLEEAETDLRQKISAEFFAIKYPTAAHLKLREAFENARIKTLQLNKVNPTDLAFLAKKLDFLAIDSANDDDTRINFTNARDIILAIKSIVVKLLEPRPNINLILLLHLTASSREIPAMNSAAIAAFHNLINGLKSTFTYKEAVRSFENMTLSLLMMYLWVHKAKRLLENRPQKTGMKSIPDLDMIFSLFTTMVDSRIENVPFTKATLTLREEIIESMQTIIDTATMTSREIIPTSFVSKNLTEETIDALITKKQHLLVKLSTTLSEENVRQHKDAINEMSLAKNLLNLAGEGRVVIRTIRMLEEITSPQPAPATNPGRR